MNITGGIVLLMVRKINLMCKILKLSTLKGLSFFEALLSKPNGGTKRHFTLNKDQILFQKIIY